MPVLIGKYDYALDPKNRLFVPPRYREELAREQGKHFILSIGIDSCLYMFLPSQWERLLTDNQEIFQLKDKRKQRAVKRHIFSNAMEAPMDEQGRILIPQALKEYAGLKKDVVVLGSGNKAEIWDSKALTAHEKTGRQVFKDLSSSLDL